MSILRDVIQVPLRQAAILQAKQAAWQFAVRGFNRLVYCLLAIGLVAGSANAADSAPETLFQKLSGDWNGWGWVQVRSGDREKMRCSISYHLLADGNEAKQELRCASAGFIIDATANLKNEKGVISGTWKEATYSSQGTISGRSTSRFASIRLYGDNLSVGMSITSKGECMQSVRIQPKNTDIKLISVSLKRC